MKTIINLSIALVLTAGSFVAGKMNLNNEVNYSERLSSISFDSPTENTNIYTEAIIVNGEIMPVVTLPELVISAEAAPTLYVHAKIENGVLIPYVNLPELRIEA